MGAFDYERFFVQRGIIFRDSGANVKKGNLVTNCPFCTNDTRQFMGVDPRTGNFGCWWSAEHRGKNPAKLVQALLRCSWREALQITGGSDDMAPMAGSVDALEEAVAALDDRPARVSRWGFAVQPFPPEFREIKPIGVTAVCWRHLVEKRKFNETDVARLCQDYRLRYAVSGQFKQRIILPFIQKDNATIGWQARSVGYSKLRYLTDPPSIAKKQILFNHGPAWEGGRILVIEEGPLDVLKTDFYGRRKYIRAVGTIGTSYTETQVGLLFKLCMRFDRTLILFDPGALEPAMGLQTRLARFNPVIGAVPDGVDDPGDLWPEQVVDVVESFF